MLVARRCVCRRRGSRACRACLWRIGGAGGGGRGDRWRLCRADGGAARLGLLVGIVAGQAAYASYAARDGQVRLGFGKAAAMSSSCRRRSRRRRIGAFLSAHCTAVWRALFALFGRLFVYLFIFDFQYEDIYWFVNYIS